MNRTGFGLSLFEERDSAMFWGNVQPSNLVLLIHNFHLLFLLHSGKISSDCCTYSWRRLDYKADLFLPWPPVSSSEIIKLIKCLKLNKAPGYDFISAESSCSHLDRQGICFGFPNTFIYNYANVPGDWSLALVIPIHKKGDEIYLPIIGLLAFSICLGNYQ